MPVRIPAKSLYISSRAAAHALLVIGCLTAGLTGGCEKTSAGGAQGAGPQAMPVQILVAKVEKTPEVTEYLSLLKSRHSATINPQVEGQITKIFVKSGDHVKAGTHLLQIDPLKQQATVSSQEASRAAQEANLRYAQVQLDREKRLFSAGVVSKQEFDNAQSTYDAAAAQLNALAEQVNQQKEELRYYSVSSPMDGIVGDIPVRTGDRVQVTTLLTTVNEPGALEAYIYVPADRAKDLKLGLTVHLLDVAGNPITDSRITFISPQVESDTQTVLAKASVENSQGKLRPEQQMRAQVVWGVNDSLLLPVLDVVRINGQFFAFEAVNDGKGTFARQKLLKMGDLVGNNYVVQDGIKAGDHVIVSGLQFLQDGAPVMELPAASGAAAH